jgi:hypothetical protein
VASLVINGGRKLDMDSAAGHSLDNFQCLEAVPFASIAGFEAKWGVQQGVRCESTARFNCHGMTFAARRTQIDDPNTVARILTEDGYSEVKPLEEPLLAGDVVVYYQDGDAQHSAIVVGPPTSPGLLLTATVFSKWGPYRELIHGIYNCPYSQDAIIKYYRIRSVANGP